MRAIRLIEPDGGELTMVDRGDAFELYVGYPWRNVRVYSVSIRTATRLGLWLLKRWIWHGWFGLRSFFRRRKVDAFLEKQCRPEN